MSKKNKPVEPEVKETPRSKEVVSAVAPEKKETAFEHTALGQPNIKESPLSVPVRNIFGQLPKPVVGGIGSGGKA